MRVAVTDWPNGRHTLALGPAAIRGLTDHDLEDVEAFLVGWRTGTATCDAEFNGHTCWLPPDHTAAPHNCRACPEQWPAGTPPPCYRAAIGVMIHGTGCTCGDDR